jgi:hypothetical protein
MRAIDGAGQTDIAQHLRRVDWLRHEYRRRRQMESQDVASATDLAGSHDERLRQFADEDTGSARASGRGSPK